jgi:tetratricopeptide (TPR) repeat protein
MKASFALCILLFGISWIVGCTFPDTTQSPEDFTHGANFSSMNTSYYEHLGDADPTNATAWVLQGNYYNNWFNLYDKALACYDRALELNPDDAYAWYSKGITLSNMKRYREANQSFDRAFQLKPIIPLKNVPATIRQ